MNFDTLHTFLEAKERNSLLDTVDYLNTKQKVLLLTTSDRWEKHDETPKSTLLAYYIADKLGKDKATVIQVPYLKIYNCEGNISSYNGNNCGVKESELKSSIKNPTGALRCWASYNNTDDELYKIANPLFEADTVMFFGSVRWGQMNAYYQKLIERLSWLENRHSTLKEENIIKDKDAGIIVTGQNWNGKLVVETQKQVLKFFGFKVQDSLCWNWQYTQNSYDETQKSYKLAPLKFGETFKVDPTEYIEPKK
jgi:multimeric flavodoxin WrbA